jgi:hypothetical protein
VHRIVQYSQPDFPGITRSTARSASHCGQLDSTAAEGGGIGSGSNRCMERAPTIGLGSRALAVPGGQASSVEMIDLSLRIGHRSIGIGPGEADFQRGKPNAVDDDGLLIRPPDPGVPQVFSGLKTLNRKVSVFHRVTPGVFRSRWKHEAAKTSVNSFTSQVF